MIEERIDLGPRVTIQKRWKRSRGKDRAREKVMDGNEVGIGRCSQAAEAPTRPDEVEGGERGRAPAKLGSSVDLFNFYFHFHFHFSFSTACILLFSPLRLIASLYFYPLRCFSDIVKSLFSNYIKLLRQSVMSESPPPPPSWSISSMANNTMQFLRLPVLASSGLAVVASGLLYFKQK